MSKAIIARQSGDRYQACYFWEKATQMLFPKSNILKVGFEYDEIKSFDDVVVFYKEPENDCRGNFIETDYHQLKFHVDHQGAFTVEALMEPAFINAKSKTILKNLHYSIKEYGKIPTNIRLIYVSTWGISKEDPLAKLISSKEGEFRLDILFDGKKESNMAKIRKKMINHLGISREEDLREILTPFRLHTTGNMKQCEDSLNVALSRAHLIPIQHSKESNRYYDLIQTLHHKGVNFFDKSHLLELCKREDLWDTEKTAYIQTAIRSFSERAATIGGQFSLDLTHYFVGREKKEEYSWNDHVLSKVTSFVDETFSPGTEYQLFLDAHTSIGFLTGRLLDTKSGVTVFPMQKTIEGYTPWAIDFENISSTSLPNCIELKVNEHGKEIALAVGFTHDILSDVQEYIEQSGLYINRIIKFFAPKSPSNNSIRDGIHASALANQISQKLASRSLSEKKERLHIFISAPIAFTFMLGQLSKSFGMCTIYEHDLEQTHGWTYLPTLNFG